MLGDIETCETFFFTYSSFQRFTFNIPTIFRCPAHRLLKVSSYRPTSSLSCNPLLQLPPIVAFFLPSKADEINPKKKQAKCFLGSTQISLSSPSDACTAHVWRGTLQNLTLLEHWNSFSIHFNSKIFKFVTNSWHCRRWGVRPSGSFFRIRLRNCCKQVVVSVKQRAKTLPKWKTGGKMRKTRLYWIDMTWSYDAHWSAACWSHLRIILAVSSKIFWSTLTSPFSIKLVCTIKYTLFIIIQGLPVLF